MSDTWRAAYPCPECGVDVPELEPEVIEVRHLTDEEAAAEILEHLSKKPNTDAADVHYSLAIGFDQVGRVCAKLMAEGKIEWSP